MPISRRSFLTNAVGFLCAPAIVRIENIMPVRSYTLIYDDYVQHFVDYLHRLEKDRFMANLRVVIDQWNNPPERIAQGYLRADIFTKPFPPSLSFRAWEPDLCSGDRSCREPDAGTGSTTHHDD